MKRSFLIALVTGCWLLLSPVVALAQAGAGVDIGQVEQTLQQWDVEANSIEVILTRDPPDVDEIAELGRALSRHIDGVSDIVSGAETALAPLRQQLEALGPAPEGEASETAEVKRERERLDKRIAEIEALQKRANQADVRAKSLTERLLDRRRELFTEELVTQGPTLFNLDVPRAAIVSIQALGQQLWEETSERFGPRSMDGASITSLAVLALVLIAGLTFFFRMRRALITRLVAKVSDETPHSRRVLFATAIVLTRLFLPAASLGLVLFSAWASGILGEVGRELVTGLARGTAMVIGAYALGGAFFAPRAPQLRLSELDDSCAQAAHRWLVLLALIVGLDSAFIVHGTDIWLEVEALTLINTVLLVLGGCVLWTLVKVVSNGSVREPAQTAAAYQAEDPDHEEEDEPEAPEPTEEKHSGAPIIPRLVRSLLIFSSIIAPLLAISGYYAASRYLFYPVVYSAALIGFGVLLFYVVRELVDQVADDGKDDDAPRPLRLIPIIVGFFLACGAIPILARIWGASAQDLLTAWHYVVDGFKIGEIQISPIDFFAFLIVFSIGFIVTRVAQRAITTSVLPLTGMDAGGRAAVRAGVGYAGITIAALIAISTTGLDLSNLAIVAGALSVGIGFGLQNVVNNFVSGIILLIERPIKAGDWIELSSGMGYVKQVNVRSTEIETFDRAALIVPNSELISSSVINWTHGNMNGRIIVPVGVAYGTDTRKVERILLEIARAHPMIQRRPAPWINFVGFGASSLDFEIRGVLRDVNWVMNVKTDINHEIASRFTQEGIEIPFPQQDVHFRTPLAMTPAEPAQTQPPARPEEPPAEEPGSEDDTVANDTARPGDPNGETT